MRLDELALREGVLEVKRRVDAAIAELSGDDGEPIVETPNRLLRLVARKRRRGLRIGSHAVLARRLARLEAEVADPDGAASTLPGRDRELDGAHLLRRPAGPGAPGEVEA